MNFSDRMRISPSNAELDLRCYLQSKGLTKHLRTNIIIAFPKRRHKCNPKTLFRESLYKYDLPLYERWTTPDFSWPHQNPPFVLYLDGEKVHSQSGVELKDIAINELLDFYGFNYYRYMYRGRLSNKALVHLENVVRENTQQLKVAQ